MIHEWQQYLIERQWEDWRDYYHHWVAYKDLHTGNSYKIYIKHIYAVFNPWNVWIYILGRDKNGRLHKVEYLNWFFNQFKMIDGPDSEIPPDHPYIKP